jgi:hypothetical protein
VSELERKIITANIGSVTGWNVKLRSHWSICPEVDRLSMYTVLLNYRKGKLDDEMAGSTIQPVKTMMQQDFVSKNLTTCLGVTVVSCIVLIWS